MILRFVIAALVWALAADASAQRASVDELLGRASEAEARLDFAEARRLYAEIVGSEGGVPRIARRRLAFLDEHDEGGFAPLAELEAFRRRPLAGSSRAEAAAFERRLATFPRGRVRVESYAMLVRAYLTLGAIGDAERVGRRALALPEASAADRDEARRTLASVLTRDGREVEALRLLEQLGTRDHARETSLRSAARRRWLVPVAGAWLAAFALVTLALALRARARAFAGLRLSSLAVLVLVALPPYLIATTYDEETSDTFLLLALACTGVIALGAVLGASLGRLGASTRARALASAASLLSTIAAAYLVLASSQAIVSFLP